MDALSDVLRVIRLDSAIYFNAEFSEPWCLLTPASPALAPVLTRERAHVIIYHLLCEGQAYVQVDGGDPVALSAGDLVTFPHGNPHVLGGGRRVPPLDAAAALPGLLARGLELLQHGGGGPASRFICGFLACDPQLGQAFFGGLPPFIKVNIRDDPSGVWLENSLRFAVAQAQGRDAGSAAMLARLAEAVFAETLRRYARDLPDGQAGWLAAIRDADVGRALARLHQRPGDPWTLQSLAREAGVSRTVLAARFRQLLGEPPMTYLTRWRLRLAARALATTARSVAQIAADAGYDSEAAFNRAFRREHRQPPARYRKEREAAISSTTPRRQSDRK